MSDSNLYLGASRVVASNASSERLTMPTHHLVTHGVVMGMSGSGKTGLLTVTIEEALRNQVPVLVIDVRAPLDCVSLGSMKFSTLRRLRPCATSPKAATVGCT